MSEYRKLNEFKFKANTRCQVDYAIRRALRRVTNKVPIVRIGYQRYLVGATAYQVRVRRRMAYIKVGRRWIRFERFLKLKQTELQRGFVRLIRKHKWCFERVIYQLLKENNADMVIQRRWKRWTVRRMLQMN